MNVSWFFFFQDGKSWRIVNCVLALKSYSEWKQSGGIGSWKYSANSKPSSFGTGKPFTRKSSEPFMNSISRTVSLGEKSVDSLYSEQSDLIEAVSELFIYFFIFFCFFHVHASYFIRIEMRNIYLIAPFHSSLQGSERSLEMLVRAALSDKKQEEIPTVRCFCSTKISQSIFLVRMESRSREESSYSRTYLLLNVQSLFLYSIRIGIVNQENSIFVRENMLL